MSKKKLNQEKQSAQKEVHRGRIQVQGEDMKEEFSYPWSQDTALLASVAREQLEYMRNLCSRTESELRSQAFQKARKYIDNGELQGGLDAPITQSFQNRNLPKKSKSARVDIEVQKGVAFI